MLDVERGVDALPVNDCSIMLCHGFKQASHTENEIRASGATTTS